MSRRRRGAADDGGSLELLLDPICNMFGTIMFVMLIAAIMAMAKASEVTAEGMRKAAAATTVPADSTVLRQDITELERRLAELPSAKVDPTVAERTEEVEQAMGEIARRRALLAAYQRSVEAAGRDLSTMSEMLQPLEAAIARLEEDIKLARESKSRAARPPIERMITQRAFTVVVWGDRLYAVCRFPPGPRPRERCEWYSLWHPQHTVVTRCLVPVRDCTRGQERIERDVVLNAGQGIDLTAGAAVESDPAFLDLLATLDPKKDFIDFEVAPDSFDSFFLAKRLFVDRGFEHAVSVNTQPLPQYRDVIIPGQPRGL
jgi:hypothetical protein